MSHKFRMLLCLILESSNASNLARTDFPELFLPFKNLLRKIRELLLTLAPHEVLVLEMLLCQHEEPANISTKLKEVSLFGVLPLYY